MEMPDTQYRRRLPHWQTGGMIYFVTWRLVDGIPELTASERDLVSSSIKFFDGQRYRLMAYVVMNDHVHILFSILGNHSLVSIIHSWKSYTTNRMQRLHRRIGRVWQREYFDRIVAEEDEF